MIGIFSYKGTNVRITCSMTIIYQLKISNSIMSLELEFFPSTTSAAPSTFIVRKTFTRVYFAASIKCSFELKNLMERGKES